MIALSQADEVYIDETLRLAEKGAGWTNPNPMVGAVIVRGRRIVARRYHRRAGGPHAEVEAIERVRGDTRGATLYVNLEPCTHFGKTPPCTDAIIKSGIKRVVCAMKDPNPLVNGRGIAKLRKAGILVRVGVHAEKARSLNEAFYTFHANGRPFVALKFAASLDGKLATRFGDSHWITNEAARAHARKLRGRFQAVLVGITTVLRDDPHLGVRTRGKNDPVRIILDPHLRIPLSARVLRDSNVIIATSRVASRRKKRILEKYGITVLTFRGKRIPLRALLATLRKMNIVSVLVEGGGEVLGSFIDEKLCDRAYVYLASILIGGKDAIAIAGRGARRIEDALQLKDVSVTRFGDNTLISGSIS